MRPESRLDTDVLRSNAVAWAAYSGIAVRAVIKANGYGWGFAPIVDALESVVDGFYVTDLGEFDAVRPLTRRPLALLADVPAESIGSLLDRAGIPTISSLAGLDAAHAWARRHAKPARVRVAVRTAIGWSGVAPEDLELFATLLAQRDLDVELSSHITDVSLQVEQKEMFDRAQATFRHEHVAVVATDLASTAPLASGLSSGYSHVRIGAGLFGARFGADLDASCALTLRASVVDTARARAQFVGYGVTRAPASGYLATVRCGYADGFPRVADGTLGILAVGMQFTTLHRSQRPNAAQIELIGRATNLDRLAASAGIAPHQLIVGLGFAANEFM